MQLASILPPPSGHRECYMRITVTTPGARAHITVQSQDEIHVMIDFFPYITLANSNDGLCLDTAFLQTKREPNQITCRIRDYNYNPESPMNPNSNSEIQVTLLPSHDGNRQST